MRRTISRKFDRVDVAVLLTSTLAGAVLLFAWINSLVESGISRHPPEGDMEWGTLASILLITLTAALMMTHLRRPRIQLYRLARQPGFAAECSVFLALAFGFMDAGVNSLYGRATDVPFPCVIMAVVSPYRVVFAIAAAWLTLALSGRWRSRSCWIDRAGRIVGAAWIAIAFALTWF